MRSPFPCPGSLFDGILRDGDKSKPFYDITYGHDVDEARRTIEKIIETDAQEDVFVVVTHDHTLFDIIDFFPKYANDFAKKGWHEQGRWRFLKDFEQAVPEYPEKTKE